MMMTDEDFISTNQLQITRLRLADGHEPVLRRVTLVNVQQRRAPLVKGEECVLDRG